MCIYTVNKQKLKNGDTVNEIQLGIMMDLQKISRWLDPKKQCLNITKSKFTLFHIPRKITPQLHLNIKGSPIENMNEFKLFGAYIGLQS